MSWAKRIFLFIVVNFLVLITISFILSIFNIQPYLTKHGIDYTSLLIFCLIWGMGGAFISLGMSRMMAKWFMGVQVIDPDTRDPALRQLVDTVHGLSKQAGLPAMPQVGIYESPEANAFATGPTKSRALVAVSTGLLNRMRKEGVEGVLGHEVSHIANGDMVTMTLLQGIVNAFVMFLARAVAFVITRGTGRDREESSPMAYMLTVMVLEVVFMILGTIVIATFSRFREYRADAGGARLAGRDKMIYALQSLKQLIEIKDPAHEQPAFQVMKISNPSGLLKLFASHPPLDERIRRLEQMR